MVSSSRDESSSLVIGTFPCNFFCSVFFFYNLPFD